MYREGRRVSDFWVLSSKVCLQPFFHGFNGFALWLVFHELSEISTSDLKNCRIHLFSQSLLHLILFWGKNYSICTIFFSHHKINKFGNQCHWNGWMAGFWDRGSGWVKDGEARRDIATMHTNVCKWWAPPGDGLNCQQRTLSLTPNLVLFCGIECRQLSGVDWGRLIVLGLPEPASKAFRA